MLKTLIERAGFEQLLDGSSGRSGVDGLAVVPQAVAHIALERFVERPVQGELIEVLLLPSDDSNYTSCVLVHGMGGTGKVGGLTVHSLAHPCASLD